MGRQFQCFEARQKEEQAKKSCAELYEDLSHVKKDEGQCKDSLIVRAELEELKLQFKEQAEANDKRFEQLERAQEQAKERADAREANLAALETEIEAAKKTNFEPLQRLIKGVELAEKAVQRRTCRDQARKQFLQNLGPDRKAAEEPWHSFISRLTQADWQRVGLTTKQLKLLAVGNAKSLNEAAHEVNDLGLVADAVLQAPANKADWCALFHYAYGKAPQSVLFDQDESKRLQNPALCLLAKSHAD
ncbi:hypothetical protein KFL_000560100 [Klebsormidium nitens]|uniref:Uncharacterized protein n=1 Tax=Klebsormidium nitens TaxID=105231 RepID=A0A1Y1HPG9_KLENI|nr:hypothetical protein KFL_000560100 [Klebsormidium nitens]|eukprot:GAQ80520.1 hypothetical protein KFL_000560100 [Klebsormidium nitens]